MQGVKFYTLAISGCSGPFQTIPSMPSLSWYARRCFLPFPSHGWAYMTQNNTKTDKPFLVKSYTLAISGSSGAFWMIPSMPYFIEYQRWCFLTIPSYSWAYSSQFCTQNDNKVGSFAPMSGLRVKFGPVHCSRPKYRLLSTVWGVLMDL